jgi:outer membrane protein TolC
MTIGTLLVSLLLAQAPQPQSPAANDPLLQPLPAASARLASFDQGVRQLRRRSDALGSAVAQAAAAAARSRQALAPLLPTIQGSLAAYHDILHPGTAPVVAGAGPTNVPGPRPTDPVGVGQLSLVVPLFNLQLWQRRASARAQAQAEQATAEDSVRTLIGALAGAVIDVQAAERAAELQREGLKNALERQFLVQRTLDLGTGTRLDLVRAQQDTRLARADVLLGREQVMQRREALGSLLGEDQPLGVDGGLAREDLLVASSRFCRSVPLEQRPDLRAARLRAQAAEEATDDARAEYVPSLTFQSTATAQTVDPGPLRFPSWTVSALLSVPIWDGGGRAARVDERQWLAQSFGHELRQASRDAHFELTRSGRAVVVAQAVLGEAQAARELALDIDRMTRRSFETGAATSFELVQSAQQLRQAELALATRGFELLGARVTALLAEGSCEIK